MSPARMGEQPAAMDGCLSRFCIESKADASWRDEKPDAVFPSPQSCLQLRAGDSAMTLPDSTFNDGPFDSAAPAVLG